MIDQLEHLKRLRREQQLDRRPRLYLRLPEPAPQEPEDEGRGEVIIGNDDTEDEGVIIISL